MNILDNKNNLDGFNLSKFSFLFELINNDLFSQCKQVNL